MSRIFLISLFCVSSSICQIYNKNHHLTEEMVFSDGHIHTGFTFQNNIIKQNLDYFLQRNVKSFCLSLPLNNSKTSDLIFRISKEIALLSQLSDSNNNFKIIKHANTEIETANFEDINLFLNIEYFNGVFNGNPGLVEGYQKLGVRSITLIDNEYDRYFDSDSLTLFGRQVITNMNKVGMLIDLSHLNDNEKITELRIGYSDVATVFVNGEILYTGLSAYRQRDPSFLGIVGLFDYVYPKLKKGENEILIIIAEGMGGWGFMMQDGKAKYEDKNLTKLWESEKKFSIPESILYDQKREVLYVTNYDQYNEGNPRVSQFISKVNLDGTIAKLEWVGELNNPLGMQIFDDKLFVAERTQVAKIDLDNGKVVDRYPVEGAIYLNDLTIDDNGTIFITDSRKDVIWKLQDGKSEQWLAGSEIKDPNVIYYYDNKLFFGNSADQSLKSVDPKTKKISLVAKLDEGFVDGFRIDNDGNYLVSLWQGILYRISPEGKVTKLIDSKTPGEFIADFEYINEKNLLIIPTFYGNTIVGYKF